MKRLVVCCDGTWSTLNQKLLTNVALTARAISARDADGNPQIVYYDDGIGVEVSRLNRFNAATGRGLDYKILEAYEFLTLNYEPGDQIYLFGYSRGAYTVRSLGGLVRKCGVLQRAHADKAAAALELYRERHLTPDGPEATEFRAQYAAAWPKLDASGMQTVMSSGAATYDLRIKYIGVWDTVGALGIPIKAPFSNRSNPKYEFHDLALSRAVLNARQAVAIDERRKPFSPTLWTNLEAFNVEGQAPRVEQLWFPGDHGGVGGGGLTRKLSAGALMWVLEGAEMTGLTLDKGAGSLLAEVQSELDYLKGPLRDKKKGFNLNFLLGIAWRKDLTRFEDVHDYAVERWCADNRYRPRPLSRFNRDLRARVRAARSAQSAAGR